MSNDAEALEPAAEALVAAPAPEAAGEPLQAAPEDSAPTAAEAAVQRAVDEWRRVHFYNSPLSRATAALNYINSVMPDLVARILKEIA